MLNDILTKDADAVICLMYKHYLEQRKNNISREQARFFGDLESLSELISSKYSIEDLDDITRELNQSNFVDCYFAEGMADGIYLSYTGIIYMENRFMNGLDSLLSYIKKIPFL